MGTDLQREKILSHPKPLSPDQRRAVLSDNRHIRIIAGAGTGKTETLTRRIVYHLICQQTDPSAIVAFTFTDKAAQSMKSRIYDRLRDLGQDDLRARIGDLYVGTIHGYCYRLLTDYFNYGNHDSFDENQERAFLSIVGKDLGLADSGNYIRNCKNFLETVKVVEGELISEETLQENSPEFLEKLNLYKSKLAENKRLTFDRMVSLAVENLEENPDTLRQVKYLLVDEYQDINRAQEKLIRLIGRNAGIFIVGDPRQTIYKWRGSDETCFEDFAQIYPDAETIYLTENRRSGTDLIDLANSFSDRFETIQYDHIRPTRTDCGLVAHMVASNDRQEAEWIATQIESYIRRGLSEYSDIGILLRSVSTSAPPFIDVFRYRGIPLIIGGGVGLFRKDEARAVGMLFSWLIEKSRWRLDPRRADPVIDGKDLLPFAVNAFLDCQTDLTMPPETLPDFERPISKKAGDPAEWRMFLSRTINFFYKCRAVHSISIGSRKQGFYHWSVQLNAGNNPAWLEPHLPMLLKNICAAKEKAGYGTPRAITIWAPDMQDVTYAVGLG
jgi:DNA helicase-2/ATP-dependent DNA helicase PcrA